MPRRGWILAALLALAAGPGAADDDATVPVRRHVLALFEGPTHPHTEDIVHEVLEMPLNHLGMVVRRHSIDRGPPPARLLADVRAVVTFFADDDAQAEWLWPWLEHEVAARDLRVVHFGDFGLLGRDTERLGRWLARFGLEYDDGYREGPLGIDVAFADETALTFEADPRFRTIHRGPRSASDKNRVWVTTTALADEGGARHPVVTGPWGGLALDPWTLRKGSDAQDRRWHLDPFRFFRAALGLAGVPAPHPCVLNGRRMWFLQVDGDGFESLSTIRPNVYAARVMLDDVFRRYRLPYTVSIIVRSLTPDYAVKEPTRAMELAREILALPHVEPASHGVLHTLKWQEDLEPDDPPQTIMWYPSLQNYEYTQVNEVADSIRFINERLLDEGRKCAVMLWTGYANPREDAIRAARTSGSWNLNGGVFRWDDWYDSMGYVSPWGREVGAELQVYAGAANENDFDGFFDTMPVSFQMIDQTIERTGAPRILKPADIYIHFYSAERPARLQATHDLIRRWAFEEETAPVFGSRYCRAVHSAVRGARLVETDFGWRFVDFGDCRTVRFDDEPRFVDWTRSRGLLGARRKDGALYLHLAGPDAAVVFTERGMAHAHVEQANCELVDVVLAPKSVAATATAHNHRVVVFAGFPARAAVTVEKDGVAETALADPVGRVTVELPRPGTTRLRVALR